jgi:hypothetical protein
MSIDNTELEELRDLLKDSIKTLNDEKEETYVEYENEEYNFDDSNKTEKEKILQNDTTEIKDILNFDKESDFDDINLNQKTEVEDIEKIKEKEKMDRYVYNPEYPPKLYVFLNKNYGLKVHHYVANGVNLKKEQQGILFILMIKTLDKLINNVEDEIKEFKKLTIPKDLSKEINNTLLLCKKFQNLFINFAKKTKFTDEESKDEKYMNSILDFDFRLRGFFLMLLHLFNQLRIDILQQSKKRKSFIFNFVRSQGYLNENYEVLLSWNKKMSCMEEVFSFYIKILDEKEDSTPFFDNVSISDMKNKLDVSEFILNPGSQYVPRVLTFLNMLVKATASHKNSQIYNNNITKSLSFYYYNTYYQFKSKEATLETIDFFNNVDIETSKSIIIYNNRFMGVARFSNITRKAFDIFGFTEYQNVKSISDKFNNKRKGE